MLQKIVIDNFKSLKHLEYDCVGLNLLTGMNGAGKSSFIQMMRIMHYVSSRNVWEPHVELESKELGLNNFGDDIHYCYGRNGRVGFSVSFSQGADSQVYGLTRVIVRDDAVGRRGLLACEHPDWSSEFEDSYGQSGFLQFCQSVGQKVGESELVDAERACEHFRKIESKMRDDDLEAGKVFSAVWNGMRYVDAFRIKPNDVHEGGTLTKNSLELRLGRHEVGAFDPNGMNVAEFLCKSGASEELAKKINKCLEWVSPGARLQVERREVVDAEYIIESVAFGERSFKPQNVGFGISYVLPVLTILLTAQAGQIIIIENPEAHLHPRGQAEMGKLIAETVARGVQVFVETHSDHVINGIRVAVKKGIVKSSDVNIAFFERGPHDVAQEDGTTSREIYAEVTNIKVDATGSLSEWPKGFMDEWGIQQMKLLRP